MGMRGTRGQKTSGEVKFTEASIQKILIGQYLSNPKYYMTNLFVFDWESDFLAKTKSGYWYEVEIKISLSDFKNDAKNKSRKFRILETGEKPPYSIQAYRPNYFSYCVPDKLVDKVLPLLPPYAGLCSTDGTWLTFVKKPKRLHSDKIPDEKLRLTEKFYYNWDSLRNFSLQRQISELKSEISFLKTEFKACTGYPIEEDLVW